MEMGNVAFTSIIFDGEYNAQFRVNVNSTFCHFPFEIVEITIV